ncbi:hypothetical protein VTK26DRAFT_6305 [Humicola hyalothermophila]
MGKPEENTNHQDAPPPAAPLVPAHEEPPRYRQDPDPDPDELVPPSSFILHGLFIHPLPNTTTASASPELPPVYKLSRDIHTLSRPTQSIDFQRLEYRGHNRGSGTATAKPRARDLYTLQHRAPLLASPWEGWLDPVAAARRTVGRVEFVKSPVFRHGYRVVARGGNSKKLGDEEDDGEEGKEKGKKGKGKGRDKEYLFVIKELSRDAVWEWSDPEGMVVARQVVERSAAGGGSGRKSEDGGGAEVVAYKLHVLAPLPRRMLDGLVAMWCLWMWHIYFERTLTRKTWADRKRIMQMPRMGASSLDIQLNTSGKMTL